MSDYNSRSRNRGRYNNAPKKRTPASVEKMSKYEMSYTIWRFIRSVMIVVTSFLLLFAAIYFVAHYALNNYWLPPSTDDNTPIQVDIAKGTSVQSISEMLHTSGIITNPVVFEYYINFSGYGSKLQAGTYVFTKTMSMEEIMTKLAEGAGAAQVTTFMIIEGSSIPVTADKLLADGVIDNVDDFLEAARNAEDFLSYNFIGEVAENKDESRDFVLEGYLYPAKYEIYVGSSEETIVIKMLTKFSEVFNEKRTARATELGMTIDEVVTLASVIERESRPTDFAKVSAVFHNRLDGDMKLQSCATVQYILGTDKIKLSAEDIAVDSKYNTYINYGLPLGPICSPSEKAIDAALYPDEDYVNQEYLFFSTKDPESGELAFSKTAEEHNTVVAQYEELWDAYDKANGN